MKPVQTLIFAITDTVAMLAVHWFAGHGSQRRSVANKPCFGWRRDRGEVGNSHEAEKSIGEARVRRTSVPFAAFMMLLLFTACATAPTKFSVVSKDEAYQEHPRKVLVINASKNPGTRRLFEDELVKALNDRGIDAVVSYTNMPGQMVSDKNAIVAQANAVNNMPDPIVSDKNTIAAQAYASGADTVLISKPRGSEINEITGSRETGSYYEDLYINTQTEVYDIKSNRLVLTVLAQTWIREGEPADRIIKAYIKDLINELSRMGVFSKGVLLEK